MTRTGYDRGKRNVLRRCLNIASDGADVTCDGRLFQKVASETGKARLPTVQRLNGGAASLFVEVDRSLCRDGTSAKRVKYDDRYVYITNSVFPATLRVSDSTQRSTTVRVTNVFNVLYCSVV